MKDSTKHLIAKELVFFFKWLLIGIAICGAISLLSLLFEEKYIILAVIGLVGAFLPVLIYLYRGIKWLVTWVNKWK